MKNSIKYNKKCKIKINELIQNELMKNMLYNNKKINI